MRSCCNKKNIFIIFCLLPILITFIIIYWPGLFQGDDRFAHTLRLTSIQNEIYHKQFLPLFDYWGQYKVGYSWQIFYPPLTNIYFISSYILFHGASLVMKMKFTLLQIHIINCACAFYAAKRQYKSYYAGLFCVALLLTSSYYLTLYVTRFALSELASLGFVFLFIRGIDSLCSDKKDMYLIPISASLIILTSIPIAINVVFFSIVYFLFNYKNLVTKSNIIFLIKSIFIIILITSFYTIPLIVNLSNKYIYMSGDVISYQEMYNRTVPFLDVFFNINKESHLHNNNNASYSIGIIGMLLIAYLLFNKSFKEKKKMIMIIVILLCYTPFFPWWIFPEKIHLFNITQYPWRLASIAICTTALWCSSIVIYKKNFYILCSILILVSVALSNKDIHFALHHRNLDINSGFSNWLYSDYVNNNINYVNKHINKNNINMDQKNTSYFFNKSSDEALFNTPDYTINSTEIINGFPNYKVNVLHNAAISLPIIYYNSVKIISNNHSIPTIYMKDGSVGVYLTKGDYTLSVSYHKLPFVIGFLLSIFGVLWLFYIIKRNKNLISQQNTKMHI